MKPSFDKQFISQGFSAAAETYDRYAAPQRHISRQLLEKIIACEGDAPPRAIVDLGCGTGAFTWNLADRYPEAEVLGIDFAPGMIEKSKRMPVGEGKLSFRLQDIETFDPPPETDLLVSSCSLQWLPDPAGTAASFLGRGSGPRRLAVAVLLKGSFAELRSCLEEVRGEVFELDLVTGDNFVSVLREAGLKILMADKVTHRFRYRSSREVLQGFRGIGATFNGHEGQRPLSPGKLRQVLSLYERRFAMNKGAAKVFSVGQSPPKSNEASRPVPVTYRVLYLIAENGS